ncbi:hypothetical protein OEG84_11440 [Hoeflea sp. G2-23]|uniref:Uncharacterized protein n=1 Tax=Hoeflea algicola TaxID=2983763 RepID=A0ABT3Z9E3_9HYPH|nr:hypothetical protein [Hoeflea algicola]MCY0148306.1 hypothetical protein [Hoeflea algicola]
MGGKSGGNEAALARADEQARQEKIREGTTRVNDIFGQNFNDDFFKGRRDAFLDYNTPQLENQYNDAQKQLTFSLARGGNLNSSARGEQLGKLQTLYDTNKQSIADQALQQENQARTAVEDARSNLVTTLNATGDAEGAANSALTRASALSQPGTYSPLGQLFVDFTSGLGTQAAAERSYAAGGPKPTYNTGLFGGGKVVTRS